MVSAMLPDSVSASTLAWSAEKNPEHINWEHKVLEGVSSNIIDIAASGDIVYAATQTAGTPLFKSTDGGETWANLGTSTSFPTSVNVTAIAIAPDDPDYVVIVTGAHEVEYSANGGSSWTDLGRPATAAIVNDVDISAGTTKYIAAAGTDGTNAELYVIKVAVAQSWTAEAGETGFVDTDWAGLYAVKFSPNFTTDSVITTVSGNATSAVFQVFRYTSGQQAWNGSIAFFESADWGTGVALYTLTGVPTAADIELPDSYLGNDETERMAYAAVANSVTVTEGGVTRLLDSVTRDFDRWDDGVPGGIGSIAYHEDGWLVGGDDDNNQVYRWATPNSGTTPNAERVVALKQPGGESNTIVDLAGDNVVAGTTGDESCVAISTDSGNAFNDIGLIDTDLSVIDDVAVSADGSKVYMATHDTTEGTGDYDTSIWLKDGTWSRVYSNVNVADANSDYLVRFAEDDDTAVYISSTGTTNMWVSKDSGEAKWKSIPSYKLSDIQDFVVASADVVYAIEAGSGGGVSKTSNAGATWGTDKEPIKSFAPYMITLAPNGDVLVGGSAGYVSYSTDDGATFTRTAVVDAGENVQVVADNDYADNNIIYAGADVNIKRGKADATTVWATRGPSAVRGGGTISSDSNVVGIGVAGGDVYVLTANSTASVLYRSIGDVLETAASDSTNVWSSIAGALEVYDVAPQALRISDGKLWAIDTATPDLESITDPISGEGPTLTSPDDAGSVPLNVASGNAYDVTFTWERLSSKVTSMQHQIATDADFGSKVYDGTYTGIDDDPVSKVVGPNGNDGTASFNPGTTYYWRVRVAESGPMFSPWSDTRTFTVGSAPVAAAPAPLPVAFAVVSPVKGAADVTRQPSLSWTAFEGAIGYEVQIAEGFSSDFSILDVSATSEGTDTFMRVDRALAYDTEYRWRVRGITGPPPLSDSGRAAGPAPGGPWAVGGFTVEAKPEPAAAPPPPPEPAVITVTKPAPPPQVVTVEVPVQVPGPPQVQVVEKVVTQPQAIPSPLLWAIIGIGAILILALIVLIVRTRRV